MANSHIPSDLIFEILTRVSSTQALATARLVCKEWNQMTYDSMFINLHRDRTNTISGYFIQTLHYNHVFVSLCSIHDLSFDFLPDGGNVEIEAASTQGIFFCKSDITDNHYICKPSTKQWRSVPNTEQKYADPVALMVLRSNPFRFKIIRLLEAEDLHNLNESHYNLESEIFDSDIGEWSTQLINIPIDCDELINRLTPIVVGGAAHWLTSKYNVLRFSEEKQSWSLIKQPQDMEEYYAYDNSFDDVSESEYDGEYDNGHYNNGDLDNGHYENGHYNYNYGYNDDDLLIESIEGKLGLIWIRREKGMVELWELEREELNEVIWKRKKEVRIEELYEEKVISIKVEKLRGLSKLILNIFPFQSDFEPILWKP